MRGRGERIPSNVEMTTKAVVEKGLDEEVALTLEWRTRTNRELKEMNKGQNIVKWIKGQRIS
jgi:hypothetical protein